MRSLLASVLVSACATAGAGGAPSPAAGLLDATGAAVVQLQGPVKEASAAHVAAALVSAAAKAPKLLLVINSPGGEVLAGLHIVNTIHQLQQSGVVVQCAVPGSAMSMAFIILAECSERYVWADSLLLFHPVKSYVRGAMSTDDAKSLAAELAYLEGPLKERLLQILDVPRDWYEHHYRAETVHRGEQLVAVAPHFATLVTAYVGVTPAQLNPPPLPATILEQLLQLH